MGQRALSVSPFITIAMILMIFLLIFRFIMVDVTVSVLQDGQDTLVVLMSTTVIPTHVRTEETVL